MGDLMASKGSEQLSSTTAAIPATRSDMEHEYRLLLQEAIVDLVSDMGVENENVRKAFRSIVERYLASELQHIVPTVEAKHNEGDYLTILTYYSTIFPPEDGDVGYMRIPIANSQLINVRTGGTANATHEKSAAVEAICAKGHRVLGRLRRRERKLTNNTEALHWFLARIKENPLVPVNLAEGLGVDFYLPAHRYRACVEEVLREDLKITNPKEQWRKLRKWADMPALRRELAEFKELFQVDESKRSTCGLDSKIFTAPAVRNARAALHQACDDLRTFFRQLSESNVLDPEYLLNHQSKVLHTLSSQLEFHFENTPTIAGTSAFEPVGKALQRMATSLFRGKSAAREDTAPSITLSPTKRITTIPSLPFFLLALYWDGSYRDLIRYVLPPFALDVRHLYVESMSGTESVGGLAYRLCGFINERLREQAPDPQVSAKDVVEVGTLATNVVDMISKHALGNLAILSNASSNEKANNFHRAAGKLAVQIHHSIGCLRRHEAHA